MKSVTFKIEGMHCGACASRIKMLVEQLPGVQTASVSFEQAHARILFDPQSVSEERFAALVDDAGFRVIGQQ